MGISIERGNDILVAHNTVVYTHPDPTSTGSNIAFPRPAASCCMATRPTWIYAPAMVRRRTKLATSLEAEMGWFSDPSVRDLHLLDCAAAPEVALHPDVAIDLDGTTREDPTNVGADTCE